MQGSHGKIDLAGHNIDHDLPFKTTEISFIIHYLVTQPSCTFYVVRSLFQETALAEIKVQDIK